jgi:hypothetical protein
MIHRYRGHCCFFLFYFLFFSYLRRQALVASFYTFWFFIFFFSSVSYHFSLLCISIFISFSLANLSYLSTYSDKTSLLFPLLLLNDIVGMQHWQTKKEKTTHHPLRIK